MKIMTAMDTMKPAIVTTACILEWLLVLA